jgi:hypothetical protein
LVVISDARPSAAPVLVAFDPPAPQRRITVAGRLLLALPHLALLVVAAPSALVVTVIGWFGALFLGRLPTFAADYLAGYLRFQTRLYAYLFLLTDVYPPFTLADVPYPVRVTTRPGDLNRGAVAIRLLLAVPAVVVTAIVTYGIATIVLVVTWFIVLLTRRFPPSPHLVFAAFVRYEARLIGYLTMVTSQYPWGLLGDPDPAAAGIAAAAAMVGAAGVVGAAGIAGAVPFWQPAPPSPVRDPYWQIVLTARAKNLVVLVLVLGVASVVTLNVANTVSRYDRLQTDETAGVHVQSAYRSLSNAVVGYASETRSCESSVEPLPCLTGAAHNVSEAFSVFVRRVSATTMPAAAASARAVLVSDGTRAEDDFAQLSSSSSAGHYQLAIDSSHLPQLLIRFDQDYEDLGSELENIGG